MVVVARRDILRCMTAKTDALMTEHEVATRLPLEGAANGSKGLVTAKGVKVFLVGMGL